MLYLSKETNRGMPITTAGPCHHTWSWTSVLGHLTYCFRILYCIRIVCTATLHLDLDALFSFLPGTPSLGLVFVFGS